MRRVTGLLALALLAACAPSQRALLRERHYPEALAGVSLGTLEGPTVLASLVDDLEFGLHAQAVPAATLRAELPGAPSGFDDLALVRVIHASHALSLGTYVVDIELRRGGIEVPRIDASIAVLAQRSHETLPSGRRVEHEARPDVHVVQTSRFPLAELLLRVTFNVATLGLAHEAVPIVRDDGTPAYVEVIDPTPEELLAAAPAATTLSSWISAPLPSWAEAGRHVEAWWLWPRSAPPEQAGAPLTLHVDITLESAHLRCDIALPGDDLEAGLAARFGARERRLVELCEPELEYGIWIEFEGSEPTREAARWLAQRVQGPPESAGLLAQPGLHIEIIGGARDPSRAERLRDRLLALGVPASALSRGDDQRSFEPRLLVRHRLPSPR